MSNNTTTQSNDTKASSGRQMLKFGRDKLWNKPVIIPVLRLYIDNYIAKRVCISINLPIEIQPDDNDRLQEVVDKQSQLLAPLLDAKPVYRQLISNLLTRDNDALSNQDILDSVDHTEITDDANTTQHEWRLAQVTRCSVVKHQW